MEKRTISFSPPDISELEIAEVAEALRSGWITTGPRTKLLEKRLAAYVATGDNTVEVTEGYDHKVVCLNSATAAEELNLHILGVRPGDEVIVPAYTYTSSASAALHCGATVKFVDIRKDGDPNTHMPEMDYEKLEAAITEKTKAIVAVDLGGIVCDYDKIFEIVEEKKELFRPLDDHGDPLSDLGNRIQNALGRVAVVADCAHSLGASRILSHTGKGKGELKRHYCGDIADFTSFSFHAVKNFTTAEGGASTWCLPEAVYEVTSDEEIYKMYQLLSLHGQNKDALAKTKIGAWEYDIIGPWYKCNMTDIMAAIGLRQLDRYPGLLERRMQIMKKYDETCENLGISHMVHHTSAMDSSNHLYLIRIPGIDVEDRNRIIELMAEKGVATNVHYKPLPMMTAYKEMSGGIEKYPNAYDYYKNLVTLPFHTLLSDEDVEYVCECLKEVVVINGYLSHSQEFSNHGVAINLFDYHMGSFAEKLPQKVANLLYIPAQRRAFDKYIRRNDTDIISIHTSREFLFLKDVYLAKHISVHHNKKVYLTVHVGDIDTVFNRIESCRKKLIDVLDRHVDKVIFLSNEIKDQFIQAGLDSQKCVVLYNYFDFDGYKFDERKQREELRLLFVGAIHREKGIMELLRSVEKIVRQGYPVYLDICGQVTDQSIAEEFNSIIKRTNGHIIQHGYVKGKEKADIYNAADVLVLPSYHEGMPLVILEALGAGCGIISTKVGTTPEILNDENAIWVDIGDEAGLLKAIMKVYTDREMLADMGSKNKARSRDYTVEAHIASYCEIVNGSGTRES